MGNVREKKGRYRGIERKDRGYRWRARGNRGRTKEAEGETHRQEETEGKIQRDTQMGRQKRIRGKIEGGKTDEEKSKRGSRESNKEGETKRMSCGETGGDR